MKTIEADWYDYPQYVDLALRSETKREADFIEAACRKYPPCPPLRKGGKGGVRRLLEPGCGGGRLVVEMAARGYEVVGFDRSAPSVNYLQKRLSRRRLRAELLQADMANFRITPRVDAAFSTMNTFRHLLTEQSARRHLQCIARCLKPGGIYILGLHLLPLDVSEDAEERWSARHGRARINVTLRVLSSNRRRRIETLRVSMRVRSPSRDLRLRSQFPLRMYTARQFRQLLRSVPEFRLCDVYDFWYEVDEPLELNEKISDAVFVLQRK